MSEIPDPVLREVRRIKEEIAVETGYDLQKRFEALRQGEASHLQRVVSREKPRQNKAVDSDA